MANEYRLEVDESCRIKERKPDQQLINNYTCRLCELSQAGPRAYIMPHTRTCIYHKPILMDFFFLNNVSNNFQYYRGTGGAVAQSVERATPGEEVLGSIPAVAARSLLVGSVSV